MKLHQLQALVACADAGGVRAAARLLDISQASVTRALHELEEAQQLPLLVRTPTGSRFTVYGTSLLSHARIILKQMARAADDIALTRGEGGTLGIGASQWMQINFFPEAIGAFRARMPGVRIEISDSYLTLAEPLLREGRIDFIFGFLPMFGGVKSDLNYEPLIEYEPSVVARKGHPKENSTSLHDLTDQNWALNVSKEGRSAFLHYVFGQFGVQIDPARIFAAHTLSLVELMTGQMDMLSVAPRMLFTLPQLQGKWAIVPVKEVHQRQTLGIISLRDTPLTAAAACFIDCLMGVVRQGLIAAEAKGLPGFDSVRLI